MNKNTLIRLTAAAVTLLILRYALGLIAPALVGIAAAAVVRPLARRVTARTGLPIKPTAALLLIGFIAAAAVGLLTAGAAVTRELSGLIGELGGIEAALRAAFASLSKRFPVLEGVGYNDIFDALAALIEPASAGFFGIAGDAPAAAVGIITAAATAWYLCLDYDELDRSLAAMLGARIYRRFAAMRERAKRKISRLLYAYGMMFLCDCAVLAAGFTVLRCKFIAVLTIMCAALDILPAIGCGIALLPWAAAKLIAGERFIGFGLIILYIAVTAARQITEPIFVAGKLGLHPIIAVIAAYIGLKTAGAAGAIALPLVLSLGGEEAD